MSDTDEQPLPGGFIGGAVRVGETVRKAVPPRAAFVRRLLAMFEQAGWAGAPRSLGVDEHGREMLGFVAGQCDVVSDPAALRRVGGLIREFHDLTAGTALAAGAEVVCHNDLSPRNTVFRDAMPVAFIDWDIAAPGWRIEDVAHACWQFTPLPSASVPAAAARIRTLVDGYEQAGPILDRRAVVDAVLKWQDRCWRGIDAGARAGYPAMLRLRELGAVDEVRAAYAWTAAHREGLRPL